jgi:hypothetical protein
LSVIMNNTSCWLDDTYCTRQRLFGIGNGRHREKLLLGWVVKSDCSVIMQLGSSYMARSRNCLGLIRWLAERGFILFNDSMAGSSPRMSRTSVPNSADIAGKAAPSPEALVPCLLMEQITSCMATYFHSDISPGL